MTTTLVAKNCMGGQMLEPQRARPGRLGHACCKLPLAWLNQMVHVSQTSSCCEKHTPTAWVGMHCSPKIQSLALQPWGQAASKIGTTFQGLSTLSHRVWQSWCGECCGELHTFSSQVASVLWRIQAKVWKMCLWCGISDTVFGSIDWVVWPVL